jgi:hypothetical protein
MLSLFFTFLVPLTTIFLGIYLYKKLFPKNNRKSAFSNINWQKQPQQATKNDDGMVEINPENRKF